MIRLLSNKSFERVEPVTIKEVRSWITAKDVIEFDIESEGFDWVNHKIITYQLGIGEYEVVVDAEDYPISLFKEELEARTLVGHYLQFDLKFLYQAGIFPTKVIDTQIAERVLTNGYDLVRRRLSDVVMKYLSIEVDKSYQKNFKFDYGGIQYAGLDVAYLRRVWDQQKQALEKTDMIKCAQLEFSFVLALAYTEWCGIYLNVEEWQNNAKHDLEMLEKSKDKLNDYVRDIEKYNTAQLSLFDEDRVTVNWSSPKQVVEVMTDFGVDTYDEREQKHSVGVKIMEKQKNAHAIVKDYLEYSKWAKRANTFGMNWLEFVHNKTGRIHTSFSQIKHTGRMSSGSKRFNAPNIQNLPRDDRYRFCFQSESGNTLVVADYSSQESVVLADRSKEKNLLDFYQKGDGDLHSYVAGLIYNVPYDEIVAAKKAENPTDEQKKYVEYRQNAKAANFAIAYGGNGQTIADNLSLPVEEGERVLNSYMDSFPQLKEYFDKCERKILRDGYIIIDDFTGRRFYYPRHPEWQAIDKKMDQEYWQTYRDLKKQDNGLAQQYKSEVAFYFKTKSDMRKISLNYPIQGTSGSMTKLAVVLFFQWIKKYDLIGTVKICNIVHDEVVVECPEHMSEVVSKQLQSAMEYAGSKLLDELTIKASPVITKNWTH